MRFKYDRNEKWQETQVTLCDYNRKPIGYLKVYNFQCDLRWNKVSEGSFNFSRYYIDYINGTRHVNPYYEKLVSRRYVHIKHMGYFRIINTKMHQEDNYQEYKTVTIKSIENDLNEKFLEDFIINMGTTGSINDVKFCNKKDPGRSLLHLIIARFPEWSIGEVSESLVNLGLSYDMNRMAIYTFLMTEVADSAKCIFDFDTENLVINAYTADEIGDDTNIYISKEDIAKTIELDYSERNIVTKLTCVGGEEMNFRDINIGRNAIINLDYFMTEDNVGIELANKWSNYKALWNTNAALYKEHYDKLNVIYSMIDGYNSATISADIDSVVSGAEGGKFQLLANLGIVGMYYLQEQYASYKNLKKQAINNGWANTGHEHYNDYVKYAARFDDAEAAIEIMTAKIYALNSVLSEKYFTGSTASEAEVYENYNLENLPDEYNPNSNPYLLNYNLSIIGLKWLKERLEFYQDPRLELEPNLDRNKIIYNIERAILIAKNEIDGLIEKEELKPTDHVKTTAYHLVKMDMIAEESSWKSNFTEDEIVILNSLISEDGLADDSYVVTDVMTKEETTAMKTDFKTRCENELAVLSAPQIVFTVDMGNIYRIDEFVPIRSSFVLGNYVNVKIRSGYILKARIHEVHIDIDNPENFSVTFGNMVKLMNVSDINGQMIYGLLAKIRRISNKTNKI